MNILLIKTDQEKAQLALFNDHKLNKKLSWQADRRLASTLNLKINEIALGQSLDGLVVFTGPGSFTGLRIGLSVANAMAYALEIPIIGVNGRNWQKNGIKRLLNDENDLLVVPKYLKEPFTTTAKK